MIKDIDVEPAILVPSPPSKPHKLCYHWDSYTLLHRYRFSGKSSLSFLERRRIPADMLHNTLPNSAEKRPGDDRFFILYYHEAMRKCWHMDPEWARRCSHRWSFSSGAPLCWKLRNLFGREPCHDWDYRRILDTNVKRRECVMYMKKQSERWSRGWPKKVCCENCEKSADIIVAFEPDACIKDQCPKNLDLDRSYFNAACEPGLQVPNWNAKMICKRCGGKSRIVEVAR